MKKRNAYVEAIINERPQTGLRVRIRRAESVKELDRLVEKSKTFEVASPKTRRTWERAADARRRELEGASATATVKEGAELKEIKIP